MLTQILLPKIKRIKNQFLLKFFKKRQDCVDLISFQKIFNEYANSFLDSKVENYKTYTKNVLIHETMDYATTLIRSGGKRIRPYLMYIIYHNEGGADKELILKAGLAIELFHTFALIHDDVIDNGLERHGKKTMHVHLNEQIADYPRGDKNHISKSLAILSGDLIFSWANEIISQINDTSVSEIYFKMIEEIVAGQMLDVSFMLQYQVKTEEIFRKNELKTALYSFVNPMCMGSTLAQGGNIETYTQLGLCVGKAYQIQDDLLDIIGDSNVMGKSIFVDIEDGQHTILTQYIFENANEKDKNMFLSLFGKKIDKHSKKVLCDLYEETGAIAYAEKEIETLFDSAKQILEKSEMQESIKEVWLNLIKLIIKRKS